LGIGARCTSRPRRGRGAVLRRLVVDTTFLIDAERSGGELDQAIAHDDDVAIAAITVAELRVGVELSKGRRKATRRAFVDDILAYLPVLAYDLDVAEAHAQLLVVVRAQGVPRGAHDLIIAATARASGRIVVTADATAFKNLPGVAVSTHR
jgi:tRNA(fMet)-specific endonuclease VapC